MQGFAIITIKGDFIKHAKLYTHAGFAKSARRTLFGDRLLRLKAKEHGVYPWDDILKPLVDSKLALIYPIVKIDLETMSVERIAE